MGYPLAIALRYLRSKKGAFISLTSLLGVVGITLGSALLVTVISVTGGFKAQFRDKVLGVNAHVLVLKYSIDFREYRDVMKKAEELPGVVGVSPFIINPMMVTHEDRTATGVLLKGVDPDRMPKVLDLPKHVIEGSLDGLRRPGAQPAPPPEKNSGKPSITVKDFQDGIAPEKDAPKKSFLDVVKDEIDEDARKKAAGLPVGPVPSDSAAPEVPPGKNAEKNMLPVGDVTPQGGFASELPTDDVLPESLDPDPCKGANGPGDLPGMIVGRTLAAQLRVKLGDCVQVTSPTVGMSFGASGMRPPIAKPFRVIGVFDAGFDQYDSKLVYTDLFEAEAFYEQGDSVTGVEMKVADIDRAKETAEALEKKLGSNGLYRTLDWMDLNRGLFTALLIQQILLSFVMTIISVLAAFTIFATLVMVVLEKRKEVALLKAIGASDGAIFRIFLYQGGLMGIVGSSLGLTLGYGCCKAISAYRFPLDPHVYFISSLPVQVAPQSFILTGSVALLVSLLATVGPSIYAAWLRPSEGLRSD